MTVRRGQRYEVLKDTPAICMTYWKAPYTGGLEVVVPAGEVLVVTVDPPPSATGTMRCLFASFHQKRGQPRHSAAIASA